MYLYVCQQKMTFFKNIFMQALMPLQQNLHAVDPMLHIGRPGRDLPRILSRMPEHSPKGPRANILSYTIETHVIHDGIVCLRNHKPQGSSNNRFTGQNGSARYTPICCRALASASIFPFKAVAVQASNSQRFLYPARTLRLQAAFP